MSILIAGGYGFVGSHISEQLVRSGEEVILYDLRQVERDYLRPVSDGITFAQGEKETMGRMEGWKIGRLPPFILPFLHASPFASLKGKLITFHARDLKMSILIAGGYGFVGHRVIRTERGWDGKQDVTYVKDAAKGAILAYRAQAAEYKVFNISGGKVYTTPICDRDEGFAHLQIYTVNRIVLDSPFVLCYTVLDFRRILMSILPDDF